MPLRGEEAPATRPTSRPIPFSELGATVGAQYHGDNLSIVPAPEGARLRCVFQKLEGQATAEGLWLNSTADGAKGDRFRVMAVSVGRAADDAEDSPFAKSFQRDRAPLDLTTPTGLRLLAQGCEERATLGTNAKKSFSLSSRGGRRGPGRGGLPWGRFMGKPFNDDVLGSTALEASPMPDDDTLAQTGTVEVIGKIARFIRPGLTEEYSVSTDGVRQDFIILQPPGGEGNLRVELDVAGAKADALVNAARLMLDGSGRKLAYNRLRALDAQGRELPARLEATSANRLTIVVDDVAADYPVRIDPTFSDANWISMGGFPGVNNSVIALVIDESGNIYIGGNFTIVGEVPINWVAMWNGSAWSALGSGFTGNIYAMAVSGTNLYVGGFISFHLADGSVANNIAMWNGRSWSALGSGLNNYVYALAVSGTNLYAGGEFTMAGGSAANYIARWDGSTWSALGPGLNGGVDALAVSGANLYAGGFFTAAGNSAAAKVAKWDGSTWSALGSGVTWDSPGATSVYALAASGNDLYVGGDFTMAGGVGTGCIAKWDGNMWAAVGPGLNYTVNALAVSGTNLYAGGNLMFDGSSADYVAKWDGSTWSPLGSSFNAGIRSLTVSGNDLFVAGDFTTAGGLAATGMAKWDGNAWSALISGGLNGGVDALAVLGSDLYAAGSFTGAGDSAANYLAKRNGSSWSALGLGLSGAAASFSQFRVNALAVSGANLYAGGGFTMAGGSPASLIAKWDGSAWSALGAGLNNRVLALAVSGTDLYAGGNFTMAGNSPANYIAKWDGTTWSPLGSGFGGAPIYQPQVVRALAVLETNLYAGGEFTMAGGLAANYIAKWDGSAWSNLGTGLNGSVAALAVSGTNLYVGGGFTSAGGSPAKSIAKWDGSAWSPLGLGLNGAVYALAVSGTNLYAGGSFTSAGGSLANYIAEWDGNTWSALGLGLSGYVFALAVSGNDLYVGGAFQTAGGKVSAYLARAILVPLPTLNISFTGANTAMISWPSSSTNFTLQQNLDLKTGNWTAPSETVSDDNTNKFIIVNPAGASRFYRLVHQ